MHVYSLIHDDLPAIDNDEIRHGKNTVWKEFGQEY
jgi:geranylgeranyl pyrophosphate synthase